MPVKKTPENLQTAETNLIELFGSDKAVAVQAILLVREDKALKTLILDLKSSDNDAFGLDVYSDFGSLLELYRSRIPLPTNSPYYRHILPLDVVNALKKKVNEAKKIVSEQVKITAQNEMKEKTQPTDEDLIEEPEDLSPTDEEFNEGAKD